MQRFFVDAWLHHTCVIPWIEHTYGRTCRKCGQHFYTQVRNARQRLAEFCFTCLPVNTETTRIAMHVYQQNLRALNADLPATLTIAQWRQTLADFGGLCAYCQERPGKAIEHFIPVELGAGTTAGNCVPSCRPCNARKHRKHPDDLDDTCWHGRISQIRAYLATR